MTVKAEKNFSSTKTSCAFFIWEKDTDRKQFIASHKAQNTVAWLNWLKAQLSPEEVLAGPEIPGDEERGRSYLTLNCHHQNDYCIKMSNDESHLMFH